MNYQSGAASSCGAIGDSETTVEKAAVVQDPKLMDRDIEAVVLDVKRRCKETYTRSSNNPSARRFHPYIFVWRRHDDQKRYYELRPDDPPYAAKFYDCCGAEEPDASGLHHQFPYLL